MGLPCRGDICLLPRNIVLCQPHSGSHRCGYGAPSHRNTRPGLREILLETIPSVSRRFRTVLLCRWARYVLARRLGIESFDQELTGASQVAIASWFINYTIETRPGSSPALAAKLLAGAQAAFTVGRFSGTFLMRYIKPRKVFLVYLGLVIVFLAAACGARGNSGVGEFPKLAIDIEEENTHSDNSDALLDSILRVYLLSYRKLP